MENILLKYADVYVNESCVKHMHIIYIVIIDVECGNRNKTVQHMYTGIGLRRKNESANNTYTHINKKKYMNKQCR